MYTNNGAWAKQEGTLSRIAADRGGELWGLKDTGSVCQIINNKEIIRSENGIA